MSKPDASSTHDFSAIASLEGAIDWWRQAGVDCDFSNEPFQWLADELDKDAVTAEPKVNKAPTREHTPLSRALETGSHPAIGGTPSSWPTDLEKFREWWMTEPSLAPGMLDRRLPPRGAAKSKLLVLVAQPEPDDVEGLLSGGAGKLLLAMLQAMGIAEHQIYRASILPAPMAMPDWGSMAASGLAELTKHHLSLAAPERIMAIGRAQLALFGIAPERAREPMVLDCGETAFPLLATPDFAQISRNPAQRQRLWQRWLEWTR